MEGLRIVRLTAENVKRLVAVSIEPDGNVVVIGGKNGAGKSSTLDAIAYALGGGALVCEKPLRAGSEKGFAEVDLGDLVVRRTFTAAGGGTLTVSNKDGAVYRSPQAMLDALVGRLSFDPLAFSRMAPREQLDTLRALVGIDFTEIDERRDVIYDERTAVNRTLRQLEGRLAGMRKHEDAPAEPVSVAALVAELEAAEARRAAVDEMDVAAVALVREADQYASDAIAHDKATIERANDVERIEKQLEAAIKARNAAERAAVKAREGCAAMTPKIDAAEAEAKVAREELPDPAPIRARISAAEGENAKLRTNLEREACAADVESTKAESARLTGEIDKLDAAKATAIGAARFPVPALGFDAEGVTLNEFPFGQASSAEQLRVSVAIAAAMNPKLRVALVRDASLLDDDSLKLVAETAAEHDLQLWLERVGDGAECSVVIEDGHVRGDEALAVEKGAA